MFTSLNPFPPALKTKNTQIQQQQDTDNISSRCFGILIFELKKSNFLQALSITSYTQPGNIKASVEYIFTYTSKIFHKTYRFAGVHLGKIIFQFLNRPIQVTLYCLIGNLLIGCFHNDSDRVRYRSVNTPHNYDFTDFQLS